MAEESVAKKAILICHRPGCDHACEFIGEITNPACAVLQRTTHAFQIVEVHQSLWQRFVEWLKRGARHD
jgi:hypothetical protein